MGWTRIPTVKSVKARNASKMLDLCALSRDLAKTEIITSAFKTAVIGKVMMLKIMRKIRKATPERGGWCSLLPNTRSDSQPAGLVVELKFMASRLTISDFPLLNELVLGLKGFGRKTVCLSLQTSAIPFFLTFCSYFCILIFECAFSDYCTLV